ncbi:hypothetical protein PoB_003429500 [Plakobranchus ocellatus]|uniref:SHSP domain-containing protein n=1 Tax=Plakobranchus ocellatus TaxID=259542 RepID=A0AAV4AKA8_9GAST|nr:hypothetical protein PoB_003429500 [Plakobranchus ocellatus]
MTSGEQQVHNGRGTHKIGGNGRHLQRASSCSGWTKPLKDPTSVRGSITIDLPHENLLLTIKKPESDAVKAVSAMPAGVGDHGPPTISTAHLSDHLRWFLNIHPVRQAVQHLFSWSSSASFSI